MVYKCKTCCEFKPAEEFNLPRQGYRCRECCNKYRSEWKKKRALVARTCRDCKIEKLLIEFPLNNKGTHSVYCTTCLHKRIATKTSEQEIKAGQRRCLACKTYKDIDQFFRFGEIGFSRLCVPCVETKKGNVKRDFIKVNELLRLDGIQECGVCNESKPLEAFGDSKYTKSGKLSVCKTCLNLKSRVSKLKVLYGITLVQLKDLIEQQDSRCAICKSTIDFFSGTHSGQGVIDHDHETGHIRGLLCHMCNRSLGLLKDNIQVLYSAIRYLKLAQTKFRELRETPEVDNPEPS